MGLTLAPALTLALRYERPEAILLHSPAEVEAPLDVA